MLNWYAVHTKPRQEHTAEQNLERQGYITYAPKALLRKRRRRAWTRVVEPLFPRYLFIRVDPETHSLAPLRSTLGVVGLVRFGQLLQPVPDAVITFLRNAEDPDTRHHHLDDWPHREGDEVEVLAGPFAGVNGVLQNRCGEDRAMLLIDMLGRRNSVCVAMDSLAPGGSDRGRGRVERE